MYHDSITKDRRMEGLRAHDRGIIMEFKRLWRQDILVHSVFYSLVSVAGILGTLSAVLMVYNHQ